MLLVAEMYSRTSSLGLILATCKVLFDVTTLVILRFCNVLKVSSVIFPAFLIIFLRFTRLWLTRNVCSIPFHLMKGVSLLMISESSSPLVSDPLMLWIPVLLFLLGAILFLISLLMME